MHTLPETDPVGAAVAAAIRAGDVATLSRLLDEHRGLATAGIVSGKPGEVRSLLHVATDWPGSFPRVAETISTLVAAGADVNARFVGRHTETPLHWAASCNDVAAVDALVAAGADLEAQGAVLGGGPPLSDAVGFRQWDAARRLVQLGARTTLADAAALGLADRVAALLASDSPAAIQIDRALWFATSGGQRATAELLLARDADPNVVPPWTKQAALDVAEECGFDELAQWLRDRGARRAAGDP